MYLKSIEIENVGPIEQLLIDFPFEAGHPKPVIIVGENGTGKSIFLSHLVNALIVGKQEVFEDSEVDQGKVYKYRSPAYITSGKKHSYSCVKFDFGAEVEEYQLNARKSDFEAQAGYVPPKPLWNQIPAEESSVFMATFGKHLPATSSLFKQQCCLYFPVNRFEEPAWLNIDNLKAKANYSDLKHVSRYSNRSIITTSPLKKNKDWLLDVIFDRQAFEMRTANLPIGVTGNADAPTSSMVPVFAGFHGPSATIYEAVIRVLGVILRDDGNLRLGAGTRKNRQISVIKDERNWVPNLFQLSTGEVQLLNLFLSIVRDYDLSEGSFNNLTDIKGIAIIDEVDSHLHTAHQKEVLPQLIASFPNVQFIITTHSPLFLMGMEEKLGAEHFVIFNMPNGEQVSSTDFSEFAAAYEAFKETTTHREEIRRELERHAQPIVFVEGDYDIRYINKAADLLGRHELLGKIQLKDGGGFGNLDKVWKGYDSPISGALPNKILLLFDCDTRKVDTSKGLVFKRVIPSISDNPIPVGIENLFTPDTVKKIEEQCPQFIDTQEQSISRIRGSAITIPATKSVNKDEKGNLCNWLCANGTNADFSNFASVLDLIEGIINS